MEGLARWTRFLIVGCVVATGCSEAPSPPRALATSERDARTPVDHPLGFSWSSTAPDVKLFDGSEARAIHPRARAAALAPDAAAVVVVEPVGEPLTQYTRALPRRMDLDGVIVAYDDPTSIGEHQARRFRLEGTRNGLLLRYEGLVVDRSGRRYLIAAWTDGARDLRPMIDGFALVEARSDSAVMRTERGAGWRLEGRTFEDASARLKLEVPAGWHVMTGDELAAAAPGADLAVASAMTTVAVVSEPLFDARPIRDGPTVTVAGRAMVLAADGAGWQGRDCRGDRCLGVAIRGDLGEARALLAKLEVLDEAAADEIAAGLDPAAESHVEATRSLRGGVFRDHALGVTFEKPSEAWRLTAGAGARRLHDGAALVMDHRRSGVRAVLFVDETPRTFAGLSPEGAPRKVAAVGAEAEVQPASVAAAPSIHAASIRAARDDSAASIVTWGPRGVTLPVEELAAATEIGAETRAVVRTSEAYRDLRFGFQMTLPVAWTLHESTPASLAPIGVLVRWHQGDRWLGVLALHVSEARGAPDVVAPFVEQILRDAYAPFVFSAPERAAIELGGLAGHHISYTSALSHFDVAVLAREGFVYALIAADHDGHAFDVAKRGFSLTE